MNMIDLIEGMTGSMEVQFSEPLFSEGMIDPYAPCEDSPERTAALLRMCPNETENEEPSPLDFGKDDGRRSASSLFEYWLRRGW
jgi:hypothetical protein